MIVWFSLYIVMLLNLTLFDQYFGRRSLMLYVEDNMPLKQYFELNFNIIPFATINNFFIALKNNNLTSSYFFYNIFGNIIAFMPMAFFIPRLFKKIDKWYKFLIITSVFIVFIEIMQIILMTGSFDIDDYILNILGAFFLYMILNNKIIKKYLDKFLYLKC